MRKKQIDLIWLGASIASFSMLAISFLLMPLGKEALTEGISIYTLVSGLMFWISIIMGIVTQCVLAHRRKAWYVANRLRKAKPDRKIGLITFFRNKYAAVADIVTVISFIGLIISMILTRGTGYICYVFVSLLVFSFSMHCILNGKIYYHVINQNKLLRVIEKERAASTKQERKK